MSLLQQPIVIHSVKASWQTPGMILHHNAVSLMHPSYTVSAPQSLLCAQEAEDLMDRGIKGSGQGFDAKSMGRIGAHGFIPTHNVPQHQRRDAMLKVRVTRRLALQWHGRLLHLADGSAGDGVDASLSAIVVTLLSILVTSDSYAGRRSSCQEAGGDDQRSAAVGGPSRYRDDTDACAGPISPLAMGFIHGHSTRTGHALSCSLSRAVHLLHGGVLETDGRIRLVQAAAQAAERRARDDAACPSGLLGTRNVGYSDANADVVVLSTGTAALQRLPAHAAQVSSNRRNADCALQERDYALCARKWTQPKQMHTSSGA